MTTNLHMLEGLESNDPRRRDLSIRWLADHDNFYRFKYIYGFNLLDDETHRVFVDEVCSDKSKRLGRFWPRGTYKTTIGSVGGSIEELRQDPELAILIAMNSGTNAAKVLSEIKAILRNNVAFTHLYGNWLYRCPREQQYSLIINRRQRPQKSGSIDVIGKDSSVTSQHYDLIILDDIVDEKDRDSVAERDKTKRFMNDVIDLLNPGGRIRLRGTFWHHEDVYAYLIEDLNLELQEEYNKGNKESEPYKFTITPARDAAGKLNFPNILSDEKLTALRIEKGLASFSAQQMLNPLVEGATVFLKEQAHYFDIDDYKDEDGLLQIDRYSFFGSCDPALGRTTTGCYAPIFTGLVNDIGDLCLVDMNMEIRQPSSIVDTIIDNDAIYYYEEFSIESNASQVLYGELLDAQIREMNLKIHTERVARGTVSSTTRMKKPRRYVPHREIYNTEKKDARIQSIEGAYSVGKIRFRLDWKTAPNNYDIAMKHIWNYPQITLKDAPDCLEMLYRTVYSQGLNFMAV
ncbi:hypothetical protein LCGC14_0601900 [marine sediment metagenome]|uniref:Terminase large subunit gp17-like C-terminal domain-containing protein n=1 Tax=marine sediment metagenome TaxID=412755 RepID=A0A0F9UIT9_9ZZZZ